MDAFLLLILFMLALYACKVFAEEPTLPSFLAALVAGWGFVFLFILTLASRIPG